MAVLTTLFSFCCYLFWRQKCHCSNVIQVLWMTDFLRFYVVGFFSVVISDFIWGAQRVENSDTIIAVIEPEMQFKTFTWITTFDWYFNLVFWQMKDNENQFAVGNICTGEFLIFFNYCFFPAYSTYASFLFETPHYISSINSVWMEGIYTNHFNMLLIHSEYLFLVSVLDNSSDNSFQTRK